MQAGARELVGRSRTHRERGHKTVQANLVGGSRPPDERAGLGKKTAGSSKVKRHWMEPDHPELNIRRKGELLGLWRGNWKYCPAEESGNALEPMRHRNFLYET